MVRAEKMDVDVSIGIAGDSTGVREEACGEVIPESLLCILDSFGLFVGGKDRNGYIGIGKESFSSVVLGLFKFRVRCSINRS